MPRIPRRLTVLSVALAVPLTACTSSGLEDNPDGASTAGATGQERLEVVASFYPLEYVVGRVGGDRVDLSTLTASGVDPHDVELTPRTVGTLSAADLVVYAAGMQPAVDDAVAAQAQDVGLDVVPAADLLLLGETAEEHAEHSGEDGHTEDDGDDDGHDHGDEDPHFWLDPVRYADVAEAVAQRLAELDPEGAATYRDNAAGLRADLDALDEELAAGLGSCESRDVVTTHDAFGYLGVRYDLHLVGITGISPESEPSPARLAEVAEQVRELGIDTIYTEPLLPDGIAETVARETGAAVLTLDPLEGLTEASSGTDYLEVMRANLAALQEGQGCS